MPIFCDRKFFYFPLFLKNFLDLFSFKCTGLENNYQGRFLMKKDKARRRTLWGGLWTPGSEDNHLQVGDGIGSPGEQRFSTRPLGGDRSTQKLRECPSPELSVPLTGWSRGCSAHQLPPSPPNTPRGHPLLPSCPSLFRYFLKDE